MKRKTVLLLILSLSAGLLAAQAGNTELDSTRFREKIINQWWTCENQKAKMDCDMRLLVIKPEGFEMNCINWSNGFSGIKCGYGLKIQDGFFELIMKDYPNKFNTKFLYGYLSEGGNLLLLSRQTSMALSPRLLSEEDWLTFEKIKR